MIEEFSIEILPKILETAKQMREMQKRKNQTEKQKFNCEILESRFDNLLKRYEISLINEQDFMNKNPF